MAAVIYGGIGFAEMHKDISKFGAEAAMREFRALSAIAGMIELAVAIIGPVDD